MASIKDLKRMCENMICKDCPLSGSDVANCWVHSVPIDYPDEDIDTIVDKWVAEHPVKTYAMDFFEKFPNASKVEEDGTPKCCWKFVYGDTSYICEPADCTKCWNREMKEND